MGEKRWTEVVDEACFRVSLKHASLWSEIFKKIGVEGDADGHYTGGKGGSCGWTEVVYEACFRVSLKHASLWDEIFRRLRLKGLQMEMILGKREVVVGGQRPWTKRVSMDMIVGEKGWTEAVDEACFRVSLKHASLWSEIFKKIGVEGDADGHLLGEKGVVVGGQMSCTKHVSGLV